MKKLALTVALITAAAATGLAQPVVQKAVPVVKGAQVVSKAEEARVTGKGQGASVKSPGNSGNLNVKVKL